MLGCYDVVMMSSGYKLPMTICIKLPKPTGPFYQGHLSSHSVIPFIARHPRA